MSQTIFGNVQYRSIDISMHCNYIYIRVHYNDMCTLAMCNIDLYISVHGNYIYIRVHYNDMCTLALCMWQWAVRSKEHYCHVLELKGASSTQQAARQVYRQSALRSVT